MYNIHSFDNGLHALLTWHYTTRIVQVMQLLKTKITAWLVEGRHLWLVHMFKHVPAESTLNIEQRGTRYYNMTTTWISIRCHIIKRPSAFHTSTNQRGHSFWNTANILVSNLRFVHLTSRYVTLTVYVGGADLMFQGHHSRLFHYHVPHPKAMRVSRGPRDGDTSDGQNQSQFCPRLHCCTVTYTYVLYMLQ